MTRVVERWNEFWFAPTGPERMAAFRIAFGAYLLSYWAALAPHVEHYFSRAGVYAPYLVPDYAPSPAVASALFAASFVLIGMFTLGVFTRLVTPLLLVAYLYHYFLQLAVKQSSFERLIIIYLVVASFSECDARWSLRAFLKPDSVPRTIERWAQRVLMFQTVVLYTGSGLWKLGNGAWRSGELLWATLQSLWATPLAFYLTRTLDSEWSWLALSWLVILGEISLGVLFCVKRTRNLACVLGLGFHLANCFLLVIPEFLVAVAPYALFWRGKPFRRGS